MAYTGLVTLGNSAAAIRNTVAFLHWHWHWCGRGGLTIWKLGHCPRARGQ
ncbi:unnamed protein product [Staurois parvus]|uniref:Uncharacterized protein n=1 Tax=Staurois parvus TaxID=386267 RepID=A0ABN9EJM3_9NEOB|nr:unnamed protein product [Staurois parvus]